MISVITSVIRAALLLIIIWYTLNVWNLVNNHFQQGFKKYMENERLNEKYLKSSPTVEYSKAQPLRNMNNNKISVTKFQHDGTCKTIDFKTLYKNDFCSR